MVEVTVDISLDEVHFGVSEYGIAGSFLVLRPTPAASARDIVRCVTAVDFETLTRLSLDEQWWRHPHDTMRPMINRGDRAVFVPDLQAPMFLRYDDCHGALLDDRLGAMGARYFELQGWSEGAFIDWTRRNIVMLDPPAHNRLRKLVSHAFTPRRVEQMRAATAAATTAHCDKLVNQAEGEIVSGLARLVPLQVICEMLGVPYFDQESMREWTEALSAAAGMPGEESRRAGNAAMEAFNAYVLELIAERRRNPDDDLLTALVQAEEGGDRLDNDELVAMVVQLIFAGHETTRNLIASGLYTLLDHPDQLERVRTSRSLLPSAVDEILRYEPPITFTSRIATRRLEIAGVDVPAGQFVVLNLTAANRDPTTFDNPDRFDVGRNDNRHLSFGFGIHYCLGANLARMEGEVVLATLLDRLAKIELVDDGSDWMAWTPLRTRERLTVRVEPR